MATLVNPANFADISKPMCCPLAAVILIPPLIKRCFHVSVKEGERSCFCRSIILHDFVPNYIKLILAIEAEVVLSLGHPWMEIQDDCRGVLFNLHGRDCLTCSNRGALLGIRCLTQAGVDKIRLCIDLLFERLVRADGSVD